MSGLNQTVKRLAGAGIVVLILSVAAEPFAGVTAHAGIDGWLGFHAVFGFAACVVMVLVARLLGFFLKREDGYYD